MSPVPKMASRSAVPRRIISRLDIKAPNLVKGIHLEGLRVMGDPAEHALRYYSEGIDELLYVDIVASLYERNTIADLVSYTASQVFVPLTVGGGLRSIDDIDAVLRAGADKVAINTAAVRRPELVSEASRIFGSQCVVASIEAKKLSDGSWEAYVDNGRERSGLDAVDWAKRLVGLGAGEILLTSVDAEGTKKGFDLELIAAVGPHVPIPVIASGGAGTAEHVARAFEAGADAAAVASVLHYDLAPVGSLKEQLRELGAEVR